MLDRGETDASSLGIPEPVRAAIETCPALRWKAQNVKAWKSGDKSLAPRTSFRHINHIDFVDTGQPALLQVWN